MSSCYWMSTSKVSQRLPAWDPWAESSWEKEWGDREIAPGWKHGQENLLRGVTVAFVSCASGFWGLVLSWHSPILTTPPNFHWGCKAFCFLMTAKIKKAQERKCAVIFLTISYFKDGVFICFCWKDGDGDTKFRARVEVWQSISLTRWHLLCPGPVSGLPRDALNT